MRTKLITQPAAHTYMPGMTTGTKKPPSGGFFRKTLNNCIIFNHDIAQIRSHCPHLGKGLESGAN